MRDQSFIISLKCLFCDCSLKDEVEKEYVSGDMLRCQNCQELNDYDSVIDVVKAKGRSLIRKDLNAKSEKFRKRLKSALKK